MHLELFQELALLREVHPPSSLQKYLDLVWYNQYWAGQGTGSLEVSDGSGQLCPSYLEPRSLEMGLYDQAPASDMVPKQILLHPLVTSKGTGESHRYLHAFRILSLNPFHGAWGPAGTHPSTSPVAYPSISRAMPGP